MSGFPRPIIVISKCLGFAACRYDGEIIPFPLVRSMRAYVDFIDVCPECEIGLGVPREPISIILGDKKRLIQAATGLDLTDKMEAFARSYLGKLDDFNGFILKSKSPSCGIGTSKVFPEPDADEYLYQNENGFFAEAVLRDYPGLPVIDEKQIEDSFLRDHFLTRIFTMASFRETSSSTKMHALVEYHTKNKLLFMAYDKQIMTAMGNIVANKDDLPVEAVYEKYLVLLSQILSKPAETGNVVNALMHAFGYFSRNLSVRDKFLFMKKLQEYREDNSSVFELKKWFISKAEEFNADYLLTQTFFSPYPQELSGSLQIV
ncbi:DUF523 and DUF1722 domain-containing protein [Methanolobus mangrovi]|uniref:DUF523 and DUF1722 domain-containing protein n=1 Tax=Methanolobus mangrovi TaxID=3072977 RepID=A0AA51YGS6_9EURY|nr:DUF523 and DUF1722 domain-containing protein [Methanolobus mangrovi]WMW22396.1 DUF523 and DUF1722 domain-containing protein [Methanolobus mangrovi]